MGENNQKSYNTKQIENFHTWLKRSGYILTSLCLMIGAAAILIARVSTNVAPQPNTYAASNRGAAYDVLGFHYCTDNMYSNAQLNCYNTIAGKLGRNTTPAMPWLQVNITNPNAPYDYGSSAESAQISGLTDSGGPLLTLKNVNVSLSISAASSTDCGSGGNGAAPCFDPVINGQRDAPLTRIVSQIAIARSKGFTGKVVFRIGWEHNGRGSATSATRPWMAHYSRLFPAKYIAAWRHVHDVLKQVPGALFDYTGAVSGPDATSYTTDTTNAYPGDSYVDIIGIDTYDTQGWTYNKSLMDATVNFAKAHGKPVSIPEWGLWSSAAGGGGDNPTYIQNMHDWFNGLPATGSGSLYYHTYFNYDPDTTHSLWYTNGSTPFPNAAAKFVQLFGGSSTATTPTVTPTTTPTPTPTPVSNSPDLVVTGITWTPTSPTVSDAVTFKATVKNQGTAATPAGTKLGISFSVNGAQVNWSDTNTASLAAGASVTLTANSGPTGSAVWSGAQGSYTVLANVDDINRITESNEGNNTATATMTVAAAPVVPPPPTGQPDLVVTDITWVPSAPETNSPVTFTATVKNQGTAATPNNTIIGVSFSINGAQVTWSDTSNTSLAAGATRQLVASNGPSGSSTWSGAAGTYALDAFVDDINRIPGELSESNNHLTKSVVVVAPPVVVPPRPDLIVTDISWIPTSPKQGDAVTFKATIKNQGAAATPSGVPHGVSFKVAGSQVSWSDNYTSSIPIGSSVTVTANGGPGGNATWSGNPNTYAVTAEVDDVNRIIESVETNNTFTKNLVVAALPPAPTPSLDVLGITANQTVTGGIAVQAQIANVAGFQSITFSIDGHDIKMDQNSPYCLGEDNGIASCKVWDTTALTNAVHSLKVTLAATSGNMEKTIPFTVQNAGNTNPTSLPPVVTETQKPVEVVAADTRSTATTSTNQSTGSVTNTVSGKTKLAPPVNGTGTVDVKLVDPATNQVIATGGSDVTVDTTKLTEGVHNLKLVVKDKAGVETTYDFSITVKNYPGFWMHTWYVLTTPWRTLTEKLGL